MKFKRLRNKLKSLIKYFLVGTSIIGVLSFTFINFSAVEYTGPYALTNANIDEILNDSSVSFSLVKTSGTSLYFVPYFSDSTSATSNTIIPFDIYNKSDTFHILNKTIYSDPFRISGTGNPKFRFHTQLSFPFSYVIKNDGYFSIYISNNYYQSLNITATFLNEDDSQLYNFSVSNSGVNYPFKTISDLYSVSYSSPVYYYNPLTNTTTSDSSSLFYGSTTTNNSRLFRFDFPDDLDYYTINSIIISVDVSNISVTGAGINFYLGFCFESFPDYYLEASSGGGVSISDLAPYFNDISDKLDKIDDTLNGEMPSEAAEMMSEYYGEKAQQYRDIQDDLDIINGVEDVFDQPTFTIPIPEPTPETERFDSFFDVFFTQFPIIQQLILTGTTCMVFFVLFRRV